MVLLFENKPLSVFQLDSFGLILDKLHFKTIGLLFTSNYGRFLSEHSHYILIVITNSWQFAETWIAIEISLWRDIKMPILICFYFYSTSRFDSIRLGSVRSGSVRIVISFLRHNVSLIEQQIDFDIFVLFDVFAAKIYTNVMPKTNMKRKWNVL